MKWKKIPAKKPLPKRTLIAAGFFRITMNDGTQHILGPKAKLYGLRDGSLFFKVKDSEFYTRVKGPTRKRLSKRCKRAA